MTVLDRVLRFADIMRSNLKPGSPWTLTGKYPDACWITVRFKITSLGSPWTVIGKHPDTCWITIRCKMP
jgi:hypothetical protein